MPLPNPKPIFDAARAIKGAALVQAEVDSLNRAIELAMVAPPILGPATVQLGLSQADFMLAATKLGCTVAQIRAIWEVECSGQGWFTDVRGDILAADGPGGFIDGTALPKILFEAHHFSRFSKGKFDRSHPNLSSPRWNRALYVGGQGEWLRLHQAMLLDSHAALLSASVGGPQIMGFNHKLAGFDTVEAFWAAMKASEKAHLDAFVSFVIKSGLGPAARKISNVHADNRAFAKGYNGTGYEANGYHIKIAKAHKKWSQT